MRLGGFLGAALLVAAGLTLAPATADPAPQKPPAFPTQAEIVTVDVVVLDRDGKPVAGLTRSDFVVREDGRPQTVTAFEAVEARAPGVVVPERLTASPSAARVATNVSAPPTRRTFAIVFDDLHVGELNIEQARRAVQAFLDRDTRSGDRLMLLTTSDGRYWATARGPGDADFRSALGRVASRRLARDRLALQMSPVEAMRIADTGDVYVEERVRRRRAVLSGAGVPLGRRRDRHHPRPGHRADDRALEARGRGLEGARPGDRRPRAADERPRGGPRTGGRRVAGDVPVRLRTGEREAGRPVPEAERRGTAAGAGSSCTARRSIGRRASRGRQRSSWCGRPTGASGRAAPRPRWPSSPGSRRAW